MPSYGNPKDDVVSSGKVKMDGKESKNEESKPKVALGFTCSVASSRRVLNAQNVFVENCVKVGPLVD